MVEEEGRPRRFSCEICNSPLIDYMSFFDRTELVQAHGFDMDADHPECPKCGAVYQHIITNEEGRPPGSRYILIRRPDDAASP